MKLYFLRHGLAGQHGDPKYKDDSLRPLTAEGRRKMHAISLGMQTLDLTFDAVLSSPYVRARQTAATVAKNYKLKNSSIHLTENLLPPATAKKLFQEILINFPKAQNVLLVGHEPHLSKMVSCFLKSPLPLDIELKKGGLCCLTLTQIQGRTNAVLNWLLTPSQLELLALKEQ